MLHHRRAPLILLAAALSGPACSGGELVAPDGAAAIAGSNPDAAVGGPPLPVAAPPPTAAVIETSCSAHAAAQCARFSQCMPFFFTMVYGDAAVCSDREKLKCALRMAAEGTRLGDAFLPACTQAVSTAGCEAIIDNRLTGLPVPACIGPTGTVGAGRPCGSDDQCATSYCKRNGNCGVCAVRSLPGRPCESRTDCQVGHLCQEGVCAIPSGQGGSCATDLTCTGDLACLEGKCQRPLGPGSSCDPDADKCALYAGFLCHPETLRCETIELREPGRPCGYLGNGVIALCTNGGNCDIGLFENVGTCVAPAHDGEMCGGASGSCIEPAQCVGVGVCGFSGANSCL